MCQSVSSKLVQRCDLRVSSSSSSCVSYWGATGQQVTNRDSSPLVTFGSSTCSNNNHMIRSTNNYSSPVVVVGNTPPPLPQLRSGGFGNFGTLMNNINTNSNNNGNNNNITT